MDILGIPLKRYYKPWGEGDIGRYRVHEAVGLYLDTISDETKTRDEVKQACDNALRIMVELINLQTETINVYEVLQPYKPTEDDEDDESPSS